MAGIRIVVNALPSINQEETFTQRITTLGIHLTILAFGRLTTITGAHAAVEKLRAMQIPIFHVLRKFMNGAETLGKTGQLVKDVGVAALRERCNKRADLVELELLNRKVKFY